jgi:hypothetical protein
MVGTNKHCEWHVVYIGLVCGVEGDGITKVSIPPCMLAWLQKRFCITLSSSHWKSQKNCGFCSSHSLKKETSLFMSSEPRSLVVAALLVVKRDAIECKYQRRGRVTIKNRSK